MNRLRQGWLVLLLILATGCQRQEEAATPGQTVEDRKADSAAAKEMPTTESELWVKFQARPSDWLPEVLGLVAEHQLLARATGHGWEQIEIICGRGEELSPGLPVWQLAGLEAAIRGGASTTGWTFGRLPDEPLAWYLEARLVLTDEVPDVARAMELNKRLADIETADARIWSVDLEMRAAVAVAARVDGKRLEDWLGVLRESLPEASLVALDFGMTAWLGLGGEPESMPLPASGEAPVVLLTGPFRAAALADLQALPTTRPVATRWLDPELWRQALLAQIAVLEDDQPGLQLRPALAAWLSARKTPALGMQARQLRQLPPNLPRAWRRSADLEAERLASSLGDGAYLAATDDLWRELVPGTSLRDRIEKRRLSANAAFLAFNPGAWFGGRFHRFDKTAKGIQMQLRALGLASANEANFFGLQFRRADGKPPTDEALALLRRYEAQWRTAEGVSASTAAALAEAATARLAWLRTGKAEYATAALAALQPRLTDSDAGVYFAAMKRGLEGDAEGALNLVEEGLSRYPESRRLVALALRLQHLLDRPAEASLKTLAGTPQFAEFANWLEQRPLPRLFLATAVVDGLRSTPEKVPVVGPSYAVAERIAYARELEAEGLLVQAEEEYRRLVAFEPRSLAALAAIADYWQRRHEYRRALRSYEVALRDGRGAALAVAGCMRRYLALLDEEEPSAALAMRLSFEEWLPGDADNWLHMGLLAERLKLVAEARFFLKGARLAGAEASELYEASVRLAPREAMLQEAAELAADAVAKEVDAGGGWLTAARIWQQVPEGGDARVDDCFQRALAATTQADAVWQEYLAWLTTVARTPTGAARLRNACDNGDSGACAVLANLAIEEGRYTAARRLLESEDQDWRQLVLRSRVELGENNPVEALAAAKAALELKPAATAAKVALARATLATGAIEEAIAMVEAGLAAEARNREWLMLATATAVARGDEEAAVRAAEQARVEAHSLGGSKELARIYLRTNRLVDLHSLLPRTAREWPAEPLWRRVEAASWAAVYARDDAAALYVENWREFGAMADLVAAARCLGVDAATLASRYGIEQACEIETLAFALAGIEAPYYERLLNSLGGEKIAEVLAAVGQPGFGDVAGWELKARCEAILGRETATATASRAVRVAAQNPFWLARALTTLGYADLRQGKVGAARLKLEKSLAERPLAVTHLHLANLAFLVGAQGRCRWHLHEAEKLLTEDPATITAEQLDQLRLQVGLENSP